MLSNDVILVTEATWYRDRDVDVCQHDLFGHRICFSWMCIYSVSVFIINNSSFFSLWSGIIAVVMLACIEYYHGVTKFKCSVRTQIYLFNLCVYIYIYICIYIYINIYE